MKSFLPNDIKDQNRKIVFEILLQEPELAKIEVSKRTTMSSVTVNKIMDYFEEVGIINLSGENREGSGGLGRRRAVYSFDENSYTAIGIQIIANKISAVLVNLYGEIIASYDIDTETPFYDDKLADRCKEIVEYFRKETKKNGSVIVGIGLGVDGAINGHNKTLRIRTTRDREADYPYEEILNRLKFHTDLPVVLENDVNASTIAEFRLLNKGGQGPNDLLQIALGEGIGAGLIIDKKLHRGHNLGVGELEYMCFDTEYVSSHSSIGWLESKLNLDYLRQEYNYNIENPSKMSTLDKDKSIDYIAKYVALAITNVVSLLDIQWVILSGETFSAFPEVIVEKTKEYISRYTGRSLHIIVNIKRDSTAVGAATLALQSGMSKIISG